MPSPLRFDAAGGTHPGWKFSENQDAVLLDQRIWQRSTVRSCVDREHLLVGVADGAAFAPCAARASRYVLQLLLRRLSEQDGLDPSVARGIQHDMATKALGTRCEGMASTLAVMELTPTLARIVSVGDSRVYRLRGGDFRRLSVDHTIGRRLVASGEMTSVQLESAGSLYEDLDSMLVASEFESDFDIHHCTSDLQPDDTWLCCTDGVHHAVQDAGLSTILAASSDPAEATRKIIKQARSNRQSDDNVSAVVVAVRAGS